LTVCLSILHTVDCDRNNERGEGVCGSETKDEAAPFGDVARVGGLLDDCGTWAGYFRRRAHRAAVVLSPVCRPAARYDGRLR